MMIQDFGPREEVLMEAKFRAIIRFVAILALLLSAACLPRGEKPVPSALPTDIAVPSPTLPPPTSAQVQVPGLDAPMQFDEGQIQITAVRLMESTSDAGDFPYPLPPNYKATDANDIILAVIAVPFGTDPSALGFVCASSCAMPASRARIISVLFVNSR